MDSSVRTGNGLISDTLRTGFPGGRVDLGSGFWVGLENGKEVSALEWNKGCSRAK